MRIWPVYFVFITIIIFFLHGLSSVFEEKHNAGTLLVMYYLILPNLAMSGFGSVKHIAHLWSIGVEEQFYLIWPLIMKYLKKKLVIALMIFLIFAIPIIPHIADFVAVRLPEYAGVLKKTRLFFQYFLINSMSVGGLLAYLFYKYGDSVKAVFTPLKSSVIVMATLTPWFLGLEFGYFNDVIYPLIFGVLIFTVSLSPPLKLLENKVISYLGKISYGIYVYHWVIVHFTIRLMMGEDKEVGYFTSLIIATTLTIVVSALSYELLEKNILKHKSRFALIKSGKV